MPDPTLPPSTEQMGTDASSETFDTREQAIITALNNEPDSLSFNQLSDRVADKMARNTLQGRLESLIDDNVVEQDPPDDEWRKGQSKRYKLTTGAALPGDITEQWDLFWLQAMSQWTDALDTYDQTRDWSTEALQELYQEHTDLRDGDRMYGISSEDDVQKAYWYITVELYRYHSERIFGATYIDLVGREDELGERMRNWVMLQTYERANQFRDASIALWEQSEVPGPDLSEE